MQPWKEALGSQIRAAREKKGLTQEELGVAVGTSRQMIGRYEAGEAPSIDMLGKIAMRVAMPEINVNGYRFQVKLRTEKEPEIPQQFMLDFDKEYVYPGATIKITPTKVSINITALAPAKSG